MLRSPSVFTTEAPQPDAAPSASAAGAESGCPTPLDWQQVVGAVRQQGVQHRVVVDGMTTNAVLLGTGRPVYLLPGFLGNHELFALTSWLLREEFCCVLTDPPVFSTPRTHSSDGYLNTWSNSVLALAEELGHDGLRLYGSGFGGLLALRMMDRHPDRLQSVALHCAFTGLRFSVVERCLMSLALRSSRTVGEIRSVMKIQQSNHRRWFPPFDPTRWDFYAGNIASTPVRDAARRGRVAGSTDLRPRLPKLSTPTLLVETEGDGPTARAALRTLHAGLPDVCVEKLDNSGRLVHVTHPHRLVKLLRGFWDRLS